MQDTNTQIPDQTNMNASQLGNFAVQSLNSPDVVTAQNAVNTAQGAYNTQQTDQATLPQLLENSLSSQLDNPNDPNRQKTQSDLASLLAAVSNPSNAITTAENEVPGSILSPEGQDQAIAKQVGRAGSALSMDNMILGARGAGITGLVGMFGNVMAAKTQQLLNAVSLAQNNRDAIWQKAQALGGMAMNFSQLKQQMSELQFNRDTNSYLQEQTAKAQMKADVGNYSSFDSYYHAARAIPALDGVSDQQLLSDYEAAGGKGTISQQLQRSIGVSTGNITQDIIGGAANAKGEAMTGILGSLLNTGMGVGGAVNATKAAGLLGGTEAETGILGSEGIGILPLLLNLAEKVPVAVP